MKCDLSDAEHYKRIQSAAHDGKDQRCEYSPANFSEECFHRSNEFQGRDDHINQLDTDERNDDAA